MISAVAHVDGRAGPQTVEKEINPLYWRLIDEFGKRTGVPVILNTSFNLRGEAIVHTPTDAIRTFFSSGMDALAIGSFLVEKCAIENERAACHCAPRTARRAHRRDRRVLPLPRRSSAGG